MSAQPVPQLQGWRITPTNRLILFLRAGERYFTRRIRLGGRDAGLFTYHPDDGVALFARGRSETPRNYGGPRPYYPLKGDFAVQGLPVEIEALAAQVWPIMRRLALEGVQPACEHLNAAD